MPEYPTMWGNITIIAQLVTIILVVLGIRWAFFKVFKPKVSKELTPQKELCNRILGLLDEESLWKITEYNQIRCELKGLEIILDRQEWPFWEYKNYCKITTDNKIINAHEDKEYSRSDISAICKKALKLYRKIEKLDSKADAEKSLANINKVNAAIKAVSEFPKFDLISKDKEVASKFKVGDIIRFGSSEWKAEVVEAKHLKYKVRWLSYDTYGHFDCSDLEKYADKVSKVNVGDVFLDGNIRWKVTGMGGSFCELISLGDGSSRRESMKNIEDCIKI